MTPFEIVASGTNQAPAQDEHVLHFQRKTARYYHCPPYTMTWQSEFWSWMSPSAVQLGTTPAVGDKAPSTAEVRFPASEGKPTILAFLRHCGCPCTCVFLMTQAHADLTAVAEKTFLQLRALAPAHPDVQFVAISHSDQAATDKWLAALPEPSRNSQSNLQIVVDDAREMYAAWGLGTSSLWHVLGSISSVSKLEKEDGIKVRSTESGNRWQTAGNFAVDAQGTVKWSRKDERADDMPDFKQGVNAVLGS
jgi:hypothetical protein